MNYKKIKKQIASLLIVAFALSMVPAIGFAEVVDVPVSKTINIAKHKPTTSSHPTSDHAKVVDDDFYNQGNAWHIGGSWYDSNPDVAKTTPWVKIDLLRLYDIKKIVLYDRADSSQTMRKQFNLYGTNDPDAKEEDWEKIFFAEDDEALTENTDTVFPAKGCYVVPVTNKSYRYIIYKSTNSYYCSVREIQVFADIQATEVTRGTGGTSIGSAPGNQAANGGKSALTDGKLGGNAVLGEPTNDFRSGQNISAYTMLTFDLGSAQNVGLVEINPMTRSVGLGDHDNIAFYGTNTAVTDYTANYGDKGEAYQNLDTETFMASTSSVKLGANTTYLRDTVFTDANGEFVYQQIWSKDAENNTATERPAYYLPLNNANNYRYLTVRKETLNTRFSASEFVAYVIHPEVFGGSLNGRKLTVSFSEKMDISSLEGGNAYAIIGDDEYPLSVSEGNLENEYIFTIPEVYETDVDVYFTTNICNTNGVYLAKEVGLTVTTGKEVEFDNAAFTDADAEIESELLSIPENKGDVVKFKINAVNNSTSPKTAVLILAVYDANNQIKQIKVEKYDLAVSSDTVPLSVKLALEEDTNSGDYVQINVWDNIYNATSMFDMLKLE